MEIPTLVRERLGGESIEATVALGDEDVICVTPTRTFLYRGEGLLADESVEVYSHDVERVDLSEGRRNTKFVLEYVDGTEEFKVPGDRAETLLKILLQHVLRVGDVIGEDESVAGVFQFSELTLVVTDARLVKHIGASVWDSDYEVYDYEDVTDLAFEEGSVATQIVLTVDGRPQRIKAPNDQAPKVEQTLTQTLCTYYDVGSLEELLALLDEGDEESDSGAASDSGASSEIELDDGISPLVGGDDPDDGSGGQSAGGGGSDGASAISEAAASASQETTDATRDDSPVTEDEAAGSTADVADRSEARQASAESDETDTGEPRGPTAEDIEQIQSQLSTLTEAVKRQNKLLRQHDEQIETHDERIEQLIEELRRGR